LLQEQSVRFLYQKRLEKYLLENSVVNEIEQEWKKTLKRVYTEQLKNL
jgi:hypothetical protein